MQPTDGLLNNQNDWTGVKSFHANVIDNESRCPTDVREDMQIKNI